jgi:hypothetical protein
MTMDNLIIPVRAKVILRQHLARGLALMSTTVGCLEDSLLGSLGSSSHPSAAATVNGATANATTASGATASATTASATTAGATATGATTATAGAADGVRASAAHTSELMSAAIGKPAAAAAAAPGGATAAGTAIDSTVPAVAGPAASAAADAAADNNNSDNDSCSSEAEEVVLADSDSSSDSSDDNEAAAGYNDRDEFSSAARQRQHSLRAAAVAAAAAQETSEVEARVVRAASHLSVFSGNSSDNSSSNSSSTDRASADNLNSEGDAPLTPRGQEGHGVVQRIRAAGVSEGDDILHEGIDNSGAALDNIINGRRLERSRSSSVRQRAGSTGGVLSASSSKRAVVLPIMHLHKLKGISSALSEQNKVSACSICNYPV